MEPYQAATQSRGVRQIKLSVPGPAAPPHRQTCTRKGGLGISAVPTQGRVGSVKRGWRRSVRHLPSTGLYGRRDHGAACLRPNTPKPLPWLRDTRQGGSGRPRIDHDPGRKRHLEPAPRARAVWRSRWCTTGLRPLPECPAATMSPSASARIPLPVPVSIMHMPIHGREHQGRRAVALGNRIGVSDTTASHPPGTSWTSGRTAQWPTKTNRTGAVPSTTGRTRMQPPTFSAALRLLPAAWLFRYRR